MNTNLNRVINHRLPDKVLFDDITIKVDKDDLLYTLGMADWEDNFAGQRFIFNNHQILRVDGKSFSLVNQLNQDLIHHISLFF